jgi:hypothetical protein
MKTWYELTEEERTPEADYREAVRRIEVVRVEGSEDLDLSGLRLKEIPSEIGSLTGLTSLDLSNTQVTDLSALSGLTGLTRLDLSNTQVTDLSALRDLTGLTTLDLSNTPVTDLRPISFLLEQNPDLYFEESFKDGIYLEGCPLQDPPLEIAQQGAGAILNHWLKEKLGQRPNYTARILLVGQGRAGKTSLKRKMENAEALIPSPNEEENSSTVGIRIVRDYQVPAPAESTVENYTAHVWDFGGQEEQHLTHQYFFGRSSLYVVLVNIAEGIGELSYWLRLIDLHGKRTDGEPTSVIVVYNEKEIKQPVDVSLDTLSSAYKGLRLEKVSVDLARPWNGENRNDPRFTEELLRVIHRAFARLPKIGEEVPAPTVPILEALTELRKKGERYLTTKAFAGLCADAGVDAPESVKGLIDYFRRIGEIIHFAPADDEHDAYHNLRDYIFIDPAWATEQIYCLLKRKDVEQNKGRFDESLLREVWADYCPGPTYDLLKQLLMEDALEICFQVPDQKGKYIAASLLPKESPGLPFTSQADGGIRVRIHYPKHIPVGLVTRLIVRLHNSLHEDHFYLDGAVLKDHTGKGAIARVELDVANHHYVNIDVDRGGVAGRSFLERILRQVNEIHAKYFRGIRFERLVPCVCSKCKSATSEDFYYHDLAYLEAVERKNPNDTERCRASLEEVEVSKLLGQVRGPERMKYSEGRISFEGTPEEFKAIQTSITHIDKVEGGMTQVARDQHNDNSTTEAAEPFWKYAFAPNHLRGLIIAFALAAFIFIAGYFFLPAEWVAYAWPATLVVLVAGIVWALTRSNKYYAFARLAFFAGFGILGILNTIPKYEGVFRAKWQGENGEMSTIGNLSTRT